MFSKLFGKKSHTDFNLQYTTDLHSHLIPGIDDGVKTLDESIEIISKMKDLGFKKIITTPHIMSHRYPNTKEIILRKAKKVRKELKKRSIDIDFEAAAEYYFDEYFLEQIQKNDLLTFNDNHLLFELSYITRPLGLEQTIQNLIEKSYNPILAHPERYSFLYSNYSNYDNLKKTGVKFQINLNSLIGFYGRNPKKAANYLVDNGLVDFAGSDIHAMNYFDSFKKAIMSSEIAQIFEKNHIQNIHL